MSAPVESVIRVSVIVCVYNPRSEVFLRVLTALAAQTITAAHREIIVVDNCSSPPIRERADLQVMLTGLDARIVLEESPGLTAARRSGFRQAKGAVLVLCDDDTLLEPDYLARSLDMFDTEPTLGAAGGVIVGEYEATPAPWKSGFLGLLAVRDFGPRPMRALATGVDGPWDPVGAGMALRREVAQAYLRLTDDARRAAMDRVGASLRSCGDSDLARTANDLGLYLGYEPSLRLTHVIPEARTQWRYLMRIAYAIARDGTLLRRIRGQDPRPPAAFSLKRVVRALLIALALDPRVTLLRVAQVLGVEAGRRERLD